MIVRNFDDKLCRRLLTKVEPDQAAFVQAAFDTLIVEKEHLSERLHLPADCLRDPSPDLSEILKPLPEVKVSNAGRPIYRITKAHMGFFGTLGAIAGIVAAVVSVAAWDLPIALWLPILGLGGGIWWGYRNRREVCSSPDCGSVLPRGVVICPQCEGRIVNIE